MTTTSPYYNYAKKKSISIVTRELDCLFKCMRSTLFSSLWDVLGSVCWATDDKPTGTMHFSHLTLGNHKVK